MTVLGIICWTSFCITVFYGTFKQFKLSKYLILAISLVMLSFAIPVFSFWGDSSGVNIIYFIYFFIIIVSATVSIIFKPTRKIFPWFFLGVALLFFLFWIIPGILPYSTGWEPNGAATLEQILGISLHHSTLFPLIASIILLFNNWHPRLFKWASKNPWVYPFAFGVLTFAITSQIPSIFKYGTPWW